MCRRIRNAQSPPLALGTECVDWESQLFGAGGFVTFARTISNFGLNTRIQTASIDEGRIAVREAGMPSGGIQ
jgi:hypothetical protein